MMASDEDNAYIVLHEYTSKNHKYAREKMGECTHSFKVVSLHKILN